MKRIKFQCSISNVKSLFCILFLTLPSLNAQHMEKTELLIESLATAINSKSAEGLDPWLADDFSIMGQKGEMATTVLHMLITQLNDTIITYEKLQHQETPEGMHLKYDFEYKKLGNKVVEITLNQNYLVKELKLVDGKVKTLDQSNKPRVKIPSGKTVFHIPIAIKGNLIFSNVMVNGEKQKFIIDSGSPRTILNAAYHTTASSISSSKGISGQSASDLDIIPVASLQLYGLSFENEELLTADLTHLENALNTEVHGLIGADLLEAFDVVFDYKNQTVSLVDPKVFETYKQSELDGINFHKVPFVAQQGHLPVIALTVDSMVFNVILDCGASTNAMAIDLQDAVKPYLSDISSSDLRGLSKTSQAKTTGKISEGSIGVIKYKEMKTIFTGLSHLGQPGEAEIDGIIGYEVLAKQKAILSYKRQELLLER